AARLAVAGTAQRPPQPRLAADRQCGTRRRDALPPRAARAGASVPGRARRPVSRSLARAGRALERDDPVPGSSPIRFCAAWPGGLRGRATARSVTRLEGVARGVLRRLRL